MTMCVKNAKWGFSSPISLTIILGPSLAIKAKSICRKNILINLKKYLLMMLSLFVQ